jgi:Right handed beta helix region
MKTRIMQTMVTAGLMVTIGLLGNPRDARGLACGDTIGPNAGLVAMTADLDCTLGLPYGLKVVGPGTILDMKGHYIDGASDYNCIEIWGKGAVVKNGMVQDCGTGIDVPNPGLGAHTISNIDSRFNADFGFIIVADGNKLLSNSADSNGDGFGEVGFLINGKNNTLLSNMATNNYSDGFESTNTGNTFIRNSSSGNSRNGFTLAGLTFNILVLNTATRNGDHGFWGVVADSSTFSQNSALYNTSSGFELSGNRIVVSLNNAFGNLAGIHIVGAYNKLVANRLDGNTSDGLYIVGPNDVAAQNRTDGNGDYGIETDPSTTGGIFKSNVAFGNYSGVDLYDGVPSCSGIWVANSFHSTNLPACVH